MPSILVRDLDQKTVQRLKARARLNRRSPQVEIKDILERAARTLTMEGGATRVQDVASSPRRVSVLGNGVTVIKATYGRDDTISPRAALVIRQRGHACGGCPRVSTS